MSSKTYIIAWDKALENCLDIDRQLSAANASYKFLNVSSDKSERPDWENSEDVRYYGHFFNALKDFMISGKTVFGFNAGDGKSTDYAAITKKAEKILSNGGVYAPSIEGDLFSGHGAYIENSSVHPDLYLATHTNGICIYMHKNIADIAFSFLSWLDTNRVDFSSMHSGWGIDTVYCVSAIYTNQPIYRDLELYVDHPTGTSYDSHKAEMEMAFIHKAFKQYASTHLGWDAESIIRIIQLMWKKAGQRQSYKLKLQDLYPNGVEGEW